MIDELIEQFTLILNEDQCINPDRIENAGTLGHFLDMAAIDNPRVKLHYRDSEKLFTLDNFYDMQIGAVCLDIDNALSASANFGLVNTAKNLSYRWDLICYVHNPKIMFPIERLAMAFSRVDGCSLARIEVNPVQVVLRHGLVYPKELTSYPPNLRAFAFTFAHQTFPTKY